jgi:hypothetical protein
MTEVMPCDECGQAHVRPTHPGVPTCIRHKAKHNGGGPCLQWRWTGQLVCKRHGAMTPAAKEAGARRVADARVRKELGSVLFDRDAAPVRDVTASALRLAGKLEAMVDGLGDRLNGDSLSQEDRAFFTATVGQLAPLLTRLGALRLGERMVELDAERLQLVRVALGRAVAAAELGADARAVVFRVFAAEVRAQGPLVIEEGE